MGTNPITRAAIVKALVNHGALSTAGFPSEQSVDADIAEAITKHGLHMTLCGTHAGKAVTYAKAFELVTGERLTLKRHA